jgi:hypothetical protein
MNFYNTQPYKKIVKMQNFPSWSALQRLENKYVLKINK